MCSTDQFGGMYWGFIVSKKCLLHLTSKAKMAPWLLMKCSTTFHAWGTYSPFNILDKKLWVIKDYFYLVARNTIILRDNFWDILNERFWSIQTWRPVTLHKNSTVSSKRKRSCPSYSIFRGEIFELITFEHYTEK